MQRMLLKDEQLKNVTALPSSNTNVTSKGIDLGSNATGDFVADVEFLVTLDAVATGQLGNAATHKVDVVGGTSVDANNVIQSPVTIAQAILTQTGAGGAGAASVSARYRAAADFPRYIGFKVNKSDAVDASAKYMTVEVVK